VIRLSAPVGLPLQLGITAVWLGLVATAAYAISRRPQVSNETVRKVVHIGTGNVILLAWWQGIPAWVGLGASALFVGVTLTSYLLPVIPGIDSIGRQSYGTLFYALSIGVLMALFWPEQPQFAALGILTMTWGDGLAALVGIRYGRRRFAIAGGTKSLEGSLTMLLVSFAVCLGLAAAVYGVSLTLLPLCLAIALLATALETLSWYGIDNLTVPLGTALAAAWLLG
jgi:phytol kinase